MKQYIVTTGVQSRQLVQSHRIVSIVAPASFGALVCVSVLPINTGVATRVWIARKMNSRRTITPYSFVARSVRQTDSGRWSRQTASTAWRAIIPRRTTPRV